MAIEASPFQNGLAGRGELPGEDALLRHRQDIKQEASLVRAALEGIEVPQLEPGEPAGSRAVMEPQPGIDGLGDEAPIAASEEASAPEKSADTRIGRIGSGLGDLADQLQ